VAYLLLDRRVLLNGGRQAHFPALIIEGGFNFSGQFYCRPIHDTAPVSLRQVANTFRKWKP
jgi:hypothetical protein